MKDIDPLYTDRRLPTRRHRVPVRCRERTGKRARKPLTGDDEASIATK
jgi:hypothetical protein